MTSLEKNLDAALEVAVEALRRIEGSDPGPAHYIAKNALDEIQSLTIDKEDEGAPDTHQ